MLQDLSQQPLTLEEYTDLTKKQILEHVGPDAILSTKSVTFAGFPAVEMIYKMTPTGYDLKLRQYWFIKDKTAFLFTYTAEKLQYDHYEEAALKTIHSFKLIQ